MDMRKSCVSCGTGWKDQLLSCSATFWALHIQYNQEDKTYRKVYSKVWICLQCQNPDSPSDNITLFRANGREGRQKVWSCFRNIAQLNSRRGSSSLCRPYNLKKIIFFYFQANTHLGRLWLRSRAVDPSNPSPPGHMLKCPCATLLSAPTVLRQQCVWSVCE